MDEKDLVQQAKQGNRKALQQLISAQYPILSGYVMKMVGKRELAQDIVQDTLLKGIENLDRYRHEGKFSTWLIQIATNRMKDEWRKQQNRFPTEELEGTIPGHDKKPEEEALQRLEVEEAMEILQILPLEKRSVFILKHYYGYKYEEIAAMLSCPIGTVRSRLHYCVKKIMEEVERRGLNETERKERKAGH
jgi:RNA polymerase sigma-70 factor (ECF subfamily)